MSTSFETKDWGFAQTLSHITNSLPSVKKVGGKPVFEFREEDRHPDYSYEELQRLYFSEDGIAISNARDLLEVGRDIRNLVLGSGR